MKKNRNYDERQLYARGKAFKWALYIMLMSLIVWEVLCELKICSANPLTELLILIVPAFIVLMIICIVNDAYDPINTRPGLIIFTMMPITSIGMIITYIKNAEPIIEKGHITESGGIFFIYTAWIIVSLTYWIYLLKEKNKNN